MFMPAQMEAVAKEQMRDRERAWRHDTLLAGTRSPIASEGGSRRTHPLSIVLKIEHTLVQWLARDVQRRSLHSAVTIAFARFGRLHPRWVASRFDRHFVMHHLLPMLIVARETGVPVTPEQVAERYVAQIDVLPKSRARMRTEVMPVAACFLHLVDTALEDTCMTTPANGTQLASCDLPVLS